MQLENKKALITGGSNGIGEAIGIKFSEEGAEIIVFDQEEPSYEAQYFEVDVRNEREIVNALGDIDQLDILVNNAGIYRHTPIDEFSHEEFHELVETNIKGYRMMYTHFLPLLQASEDGNVINITSALSESPEPYSDIYSGTKAFINAMQTAWANSHAETGVRVNAVLPGPVNTDMLTDNFTKEELEEYRELQSGRKFSDPEDIAKLALYFATTERENGSRLTQGEAHNNQYGL